jgi:hypothetical protein
MLIFVSFSLSLTPLNDAESCKLGRFDLVSKQFANLALSHFNVSSRL